MPGQMPSDGCDAMSEEDMNTFSKMSLQSDVKSERVTENDTEESFGKRTYSLRPMSEDEKDTILKHSDLWYCYLMINFDANQKINTHIGRSRRPDLKVNEYNNAGIRSRSRRSRVKQGSDWILTMITGPFMKQEEAEEFKVQWKKQSRGIQPRRKKGMLLASKWKVTCWDGDLNDAINSQDKGTSSIGSVNSTAGQEDDAIVGTNSDEAS